MSITETMTTLPTAPDRSSPSTFSDRADAFVGALPTFGEELNSIGSEINSTIDYLLTIENEIETLKDDVETLKDDTQNIKDDAINDTTDVLSDCQTARDATIAVSGASIYAAGTTYVVGESCIGSDGNTYRRINTAIAGDNPVDSETGNWRQLTILTDYTQILSLKTDITAQQIIQDNSVGIGLSDCHIEENTEVYIGENAEWRLI